MRLLRHAVLVALLPLPLAGCPEVVRGPRLVHYNPDWFYVRHAPLIDGDAAADRLAGEECGRRSARALPADVLQVYPFDLRYAIYRCVAADGGAAGAG
jgi:hypothetical protein